MRIFKFYKTSVGKKVVVAITGFILFAFLVLHMLGNLNIYSGAEKIDAYSLYLRQFAEGFFGFGGFLWIVQDCLVVSVHPAHLDHRSACEAESPRKTDSLQAEEAICCNDRWRYYVGDWSNHSHLLSAAHPAIYNRHHSANALQGD